MDVLEVILQEFVAENADFRMTCARNKGDMFFVIPFTINPIFANASAFVKEIRRCFLCLLYTSDAADE